MSVKTMLDKCRSQLGYQEEPPHSNYTKYGAWYGINPGPWCDMWISWCAAQVFESTQVGKFAWTVAHAKWFVGKRQWGMMPKVGAIVFFDWSGSKSIDAIDHVGIVETVNADGSVTTIEGNSDDVCKRVIRRANIVGYGYPAYTPDPAVNDLPYTQAQLESFYATGMRKALNEGAGVGQATWASTVNVNLKSTQEIADTLNSIKAGLGDNMDAILAALVIAYAKPSELGGST